MQIDLDEWVDPEALFEHAFADEPYSFWLDDALAAPGARSYVGIPSADSWVAYQYEKEPFVRKISLTATTEDEFIPGSIFDFLQLERAGSTGSRDGLGSASLDADRFRMGWVGWFGYELGADTVGSVRHESEHPLAAVMFVDQVIEFDHDRQIVRVFALGSPEKSEGWVTKIGQAISEVRANDGGQRAGCEPEPEGATMVATLRHSRAEYLDMLEECRHHIHQGDAYQICLTNEIRIDGELDSFETYRRLRRNNPSHHGALLRFRGVSLLSSSPEQFLDITPGGTITTRPIKGTRRRDADARLDAELITELVQSEKERAENVMIVDLMRNDLTRVAQVGSVSVPDLFRVESYQNVHQLVSTVTAQLLPETSWVDVVRICLPAGSMTGAPKKSAMTIIDKLERGPRGLYAGAFGFMSLDGAVDLAMTIRSIVIDSTGATIGTGGGITALSDDEDEFEEMLLKAVPMLEAAQAVLTEIPLPAW